MNIPPVALVNLASFAVPPAAGAVRWKSLGRPSRLLGVYVAYVLVNEYAMFALAMNSVNNLWMLHVLTLVELLFLGAIFVLFPEMGPFRKAIVLSAAGYALYWAACKVFLESFTSFENYSSPPANILLILYALAALHTASQSVEEPVWRMPLFWYSAAVLVSFVGDFTLFTFSEWVAALKTVDVVTVWSIHWVMSTVVNLLYAATFLCRPRTPAPTGP